jgi:hypothetical protein
MKHVAHIINRSTEHVRETLGLGDFYLLLSGLLGGSHYSSGQSCDRPPQRRLLGFFISPVLKQMMR